MYCLGPEARTCSHSGRLGTRLLFPREQRLLKPSCSETALALICNPCCSTLSTRSKHVARTSLRRSKGSVCVLPAIADKNAQHAVEGVDDTPAEPSDEYVDQVFRMDKGSWRVRAYTPGDWGEVLYLQTDAFHERPLLPVLTELSFRMFQAEVRDALSKKIKSMANEQYALLVAELPPSGQEGCADSAPNDESGSGSVPAQRWCIAGVVEVAVMRAPDVLDHLPKGTEWYVYISSMAVATSQRRKGVAQALMAAAEHQAQAMWGQQHLALHVFQDNLPAIDLYTRCGYKVVSQEPSWKAMIPGGRVQVLMAKQLHQ